MAESSIDALNAFDSILVLTMHETMLEFDTKYIKVFGFNLVEGI
jgi:hypothetical protein